jgi:acyl-coenzyme A synthetase/AMP-(fatty) acid ligase
MLNYEESYSSFSWERPDKYNFATDVIDRWAEQDPAKLAMWWIDDDSGEVKKLSLRSPASQKNFVMFLLMQAYNAATQSFLCSAAISNGG